MTRAIKRRDFLAASAGVAAGTSFACSTRPVPASPALRVASWLASSYTVPDTRAPAPSVSVAVAEAGVPPLQLGSRLVVAVVATVALPEKAVFGAVAATSSGSAAAGASEPVSGSVSPSVSVSSTSIPGRTAADR